MLIRGREGLDVSGFTTAGGMLKREDNDLLGSLIDHVVDEVAVFGRDELSDVFEILETPDRRKDRQI